MKENFKDACEDIAQRLLENGHITLSVEEKVALAMYKIDEMSALVDAQAELEDDVDTEANLDLLVAQCGLLRKHFDTIDEMEKIVDQMTVASRKLQERVDYVKKHAEPILNPTQISSLFKRTLTLGRKKTTPDGVIWEPVTFIPKATEVLEQLDQIMQGHTDDMHAAFKTESIARASLKHPSRPFTPKTGTRPLFNGDDYRPSSRPSSTFSRDTSEFEKPKKKRHSCKHDNQDNDATQEKIEFVDDGKENEDCNIDAKATSDEEQDPSVTFSSTDILRERLEELKGLLEGFSNDADEDTAIASAHSICKNTSQIYHETHLLQDRSTIGVLEEANAACLSQFFQIIEGVNGRCLIELTRAAIQLYLCNLAPLQDFNTSIVHASKLLFLQSKDPVNDEHFCFVAIVETLLGVLAKSACPNSKVGAANALPMQLLIYVAGTLKNASSSPRMVTLLATNGAISILADTLQLHLAHNGNTGGENPTAQVLVQVTALLRNLAVNKSCHKQFWQCNVTQALCALMPLYPSHLELMLNVSRVLSKLTLHEAGRSQINKLPDAISHFIALMDRSSAASPHRFQASLLVRLSFVLGNLTASNDKNRKTIAIQLNAVPMLVRTLHQYGEIYIDHAAKKTLDENDSDDDEDDESMDMLVKLIRLLANLSINSTAGPLVGATEGLNCLLEILEHATALNHDELMLNVVSCLTNVSYYANPSDPKSSNVVTMNRIAIAEMLSHGLLDPNEEMVLEAARAFGNLSRFPDVLSFMVKHEVLKVLVALLKHPTREITVTVCGVLMNAALDSPSRKHMLTLQAHGSLDTRDTLVDIFRSTGLRDVESSTIICKVLYNLILPSDDKKDKYMNRPMGRLLLETLEELTEGSPTDDDFYGVARALMRSLLAS
ncbi:hypothetical protein THRCLA_01536 [Thraustotheca clavata]|uniref:Uncharacterized protein n=1 Tax=Thraustotheca clavata TaxID=74557 RepID=A0A1W0A7Z6_9STRA|nr:hypothetical protein THRCLA_01536 [Thraustotheca clavata]